MSLRRLWLFSQYFGREGVRQGTTKIVQAIPKYIALYRRLLGDSRVPQSAKAALVGAGAFAISPLNIPNFIPVLGALDDIGIILLANGYFPKKVPDEVMAEHRAAVGLDNTLP